MAQARDRSQTEEFRQGCIDNSYIQLAPNVGGLVETGWRVDRVVNGAPFQYLNCEIQPIDPFDWARMRKAGQPIERLTAYLPRRDVVDRPLTDHGLRPVI